MGRLWGELKNLKDLICSKVKEARTTVEMRRDEGGTGLCRPHGVAGVCIFDWLLRLEHPGLARVRSWLLHKTCQEVGAGEQGLDLGWGRVGSQALGKAHSSLTPDPTSFLLGQTGMGLPSRPPFRQPCLGGAVVSDWRAKQTWAVGAVVHQRATGGPDGSPLYKGTTL